MTSPRQSETNSTSVGVRRLGYLTGIAVSSGILFVANSVLPWNVVPFLTADFEQILPVVNVSLVSSIAANAVWVLYDAAWIRTAGQIVLNVVGIAMFALTLRVFPFDFSAYQFDWELLIRLTLVGLIIALVIATIVEIVKLISTFVNS